jgi:diketogulonate reductase-like aldo/keto reductase
MPTTALRTVPLSSGASVPCLGIGTWMMGEQATERRREISALRAAIDLGMSLIDTAEMYADGGAETVVGEAIAGRRDEVFLVSKVHPRNASRKGTVQACERSLTRMRVDVIDLYLLHWRGSIPLVQTVEAMHHLVAAGKVRHWGVSNLDVDDMATVFTAPGGETCAVDQVLYNLGRRGIEHDLLPWCRARGVAVMAYSPIEQGRLARSKRLARLAETLGAPAATVALAWVLRNPDVVAIPKTSSLEHLKMLRAAHELSLDAQALAALDRAFPPPERPVPLEMI